MNSETLTKLCPKLETIYTNLENFDKGGLECKVVHWDGVQREEDETKENEPKLNIKSLKFDEEDVWNLVNEMIISGIERTK